MIPLKQSTAFTWKAGPFIDDTDGKTPETGLTIGQADIRISKAGGNYAQSNNSAGATHDEIGEYDVPLDSTDTNTVGPMKVMIQKTGALPVWQWFDVLPANVYDSRYGTDRLQVHVDEMTADVITAAVLASDVTTELQAGLATATALATVDGVVDSIKAVTDALPDAGALTSLATAAALATVDGNVDAILVDTGTDIPATLATMAGYIDTEVAAIKAKTDNLPSDPADASDIAAAISALNDLSSSDVQTAAAAALTAYDPPTKAELDSAVSPLATASDLATVDGVVDTIKLTTDKLDDTLEDDGGTFRFTTNALEQAPTGGSAPSAATIADAVWDEARADHVGAGSFGEGVVASSLATNAIAPSSFQAGAITSNAVAQNAAYEIADAVMARGDIDGFTLEEFAKLVLAALAGKLSGAGTGTEVIRAADDSKARITATVDEDGNRSAITLDASG